MAITVANGLWTAGTYWGFLTPASVYVSIGRDTSALPWMKDYNGGANERTISPGEWETFCSCREQEKKISRKIWACCPGERLHHTNCSPRARHKLANLNVSEMSLHHKSIGSAAERTHCSFFPACHYASSSFGRNDIHIERRAAGNSSLHTATYCIQHSWRLKPLLSLLADFWLFIFKNYCVVPR